MNLLLKSFIVKDENGKDKINTCHIGSGIATFVLTIIFVAIAFNRINFWINGTMTTATIEKKEILQEDEINYEIRHSLGNNKFDVKYRTDINIGDKGETIPIYFLRQKPSKIISAVEYNNVTDVIILFSILILFAGTFWFGVYNPDFIHDHCVGDVHAGD